MSTLEKFPHHDIHYDRDDRRAALTVLFIGISFVILSLLAMVWLRGGFGAS